MHLAYSIQISEYYDKYASVNPIVWIDTPSFYVSHASLPDHRPYTGILVNLCWTHYQLF